MKGEQDIEKNSSSEEKIKEAARKVFLRKGYAATRTRDIAEESGFNLALINYYFRSKEKLFDIIMLEYLQVFIHSISGIVNDRNTTLEEKINVLITHYIDMLIANPMLPTFVLNEININPGALVSKLGFNMSHQDIYIIQQWKEKAAERKIMIDPLHLVINVLSLTIFPFVASPLFRNRAGISLEEFNVLMEQRKHLIPIWIKGMIKGAIPS